MPNTPATKIYDLDYFNAAQMQLYIADCFVDEVTSLQYQLTQDKRPIYGYASQLFDDVAVGHVIVQGSFTINFKEQGYLWAILDRYNKKIRGGADLRPGFGSNTTNQFSLANIEILEQIESGKLPTGDKYKFYVDLAGFASYSPGAPGKDTVFENICEQFEDKIWNKNISNQDLQRQSRRPDENIFDGFDMYVVFGNMNNKGSNHTVHKIVNVCLTSQGKQIQVGDGVIQEEYSFLAMSTE
jgi:hypothetical protein